MLSLSLGNEIGMSWKQSYHKSIKCGEWAASPLSNVILIQYFSTWGTCSDYSQEVYWLSDVILVSTPLDISQRRNNLGFCSEYLSQLGAKLRDWYVRPARAVCSPWAALSLIDLPLADVKHHLTVNEALQGQSIVPPSKGYWIEMTF